MPSWSYLIVQLVMKRLKVILIVFHCILLNIWHIKTDLMWLNKLDYVLVKF